MDMEWAFHGFHTKRTTMKIFAHHDHKGSIKGLITVDGPKEAGLMLSPKPGINVTEIQGAKFKSKVPTFEELQQIAKTFIVSELITKSSLKKK